MSMGGGANLGEATFYIRGDVSGAQNASNQLQGILGQMGNVVASNWWGVQNLGVAFAALPAAVAAGVGASVSALMDWEDAMFAVQRTTGGTDEEVKKIGDSILEVARNVPLATVELAELAAAGAALGVQNRDLAQFAETFGTLQSATNLTQANLGDFARTLNVMNVPASEWENFANNVLEAGRNTAATESEILNMSRRLAATGAQARMTSSDVLGISAAVLSLGPRAEAGATAIQKTIFDMTRAISSGGDELEIFAKVAGRSTGEFVQLFQQDAAQAFAAFITGLDRVKGGVGATVGILDELGIKESRQAQALLALAAGTRNVGSEQTDLNAILAASARWGSTNEALLAVQAAKTKTLSGQLQILRNIMFELASGIGGIFVGPLGFGISLLGDLAKGFMALPGPVKALYAGLLLVITALSAVAAGAFLIVPRIVIAAEAFRRLRSGAIETVGPLGTATFQMMAAGNAATYMGSTFAAARRQMDFAAINRNIAAFSGATAVANTRTAALSASQATAAAGMSRMVTWGTRLAKVGGWVSAALAGLTIVTTILGSRQKETAADVQEAATVNLELAQIMQEQGATVGPASDAWIEASNKFITAAATAGRLGISLITLKNIITGMGSAKELGQIVGAIEKGDKKAVEMGRNILALADEYQATAAAANVSTGAIDTNTGAMGGNADAANKVNRALQEQYELLQKQAQAHLDYADAIDNASEAAESLADAQEAYNDAIAEAGDPARLMLRAELELAQARFDEADALRDLAGLEKDVANARAKGVRRVRDAELDLEDARSSAFDAQQKILDLEEKLAELREGPSLDDLTDATNKLREAQLRLIKAHRTVEDAEWNLQHLREEGASNRDIADAEFALQEAQLGVAQAQDEVSDSTKELNGLRDGTELQEEIADLERQIADAYRDSERAAQNVVDRENDLEEARARVANDLDYLEAQDALVDAQLRVQDALLKTAEAELALQDLRNNGVSKVVGRAADDLYDAIVAQAKANRDARKEAAAMSGVFWDEADSAHALADELASMLDLAPDARTRRQLEDYIAILRSTPDVPDRPDPDSGGGGGGAGGFEVGDLGVPEAIDGLGALQDAIDNFEEKNVKKKSIWEQIFDGLGGGSGIGAIAGGALGGIVGGPAGAIVGALIGSVIGGLVEKFWPAISDFFMKDMPSFVAGNIGLAIGGPMGAVAGFVVTRFREDIVGGFKSAGGWLVGAGNTVVQGLWQGLQDGWDFLLRNFLEPIGGWIKDRFINAPLWLVNAGWGLLQGLWQGAQKGWDWLVQNFFNKIPEWLGTIFISAPNWLLQKGGEIISGLYNGALNWWSTTAWPWISGLPGKIVGVFDDIWQKMWDVGSEAVKGFARGVQEEWNQKKQTIDNWATSVVRVIKAPFGLGSPSNVFCAMGRSAVSSFAEGFEQQAPRTENILRTTTEDLVAAMRDADTGHDLGRTIMEGLIAGFLSQRDGLAQMLEETSGIMDASLAKDYVSSLLADPNLLRDMFNNTSTGISSALHSPTAGVVNNYETFQLEAHTDADPEDLVETYIWAKRVKLRQGRP